jgi:hypothetical protein
MESLNNLGEFQVFNIILKQVFIIPTVVVSLIKNETVAYACTTLSDSLPATPEEAFGFSVFPRSGWITFDINTQDLYRIPPLFSFVGLTSKIFFAAAIFFLVIQMIATASSFCLCLRDQRHHHHHYMPVST